MIASRKTLGSFRISKKRFTAMCKPCRIGIGQKDERKQKEGCYERVEAKISKPDRCICFFGRTKGGFYRKLYSEIFRNANR